MDKNEIKHLKQVCFNGFDDLKIKLNEFYKLATRNNIKTNDLKYLNKKLLPKISNKITVLNFQLSYLKELEDCSIGMYTHFSAINDIISTLSTIVYSLQSLLEYNTYELTVIVDLISYITNDLSEMLDKIFNEDLKEFLDNE